MNEGRTGWRRQERRSPAPSVPAERDWEIESETVSWLPTALPLAFPLGHVCCTWTLALSWEPPVSAALLRTC